MAVTIPKEYLKDGLKAGMDVIVERDEDTGKIIISPRMQVERNKSTITPEFLKWLESFNKEYGPALKALAKR